MTLRAICEEIIAALKLNSTKLGVDADSITLGVFGSTPTAAPFVLVFALPGEAGSEDSTPNGTYIADVNIYTGSESAVDAATAAFDALEIAERAARIIESSGVAKYINSAGEFAFGMQAKSSDRGNALLSYNMLYTTSNLIPEGE